ncbi:sensor histidine kinase [Natranaeroarchaeum aerophilus]|uniref:histidine kinase n=1 Tax=Natranaeroarchaeum aerophilus TaxID=2917711 RepID=A0AAE3FN89_9EURY|nr:ATP-binding protein [Natranaeroarchaeum aerophilus]MCL9812259.1 ATP-binding protein [Natranaeroarchaeum aerophilus]
MSSILLSGYVAVFGVSAVACFVSLSQLPRIQNTDVRVGLFSLLTICGVWAAAHVGYLIMPSAMGKLVFYVAGLIAGIAAVGAWLYFCSAYTDRRYHRQRSFRFLAVIVFTGIVLLKLTNPVHSLYFTTEIVSTPFSHLAVDHGLLHWSVMALAYALSFVGFFMLFERFVTVGFDTTPVAILVGITALPVVLDILGNSSPALVDMTYEPIGVAVFAVGVLFVYRDRFQRLNLSDASDRPVIFLDEEYHIRDYNRRAQELFPVLENSIDNPLSDVSSQLADGLRSEQHIIEYVTDTETRYYIASVAPFTAGETVIGHIFTLTDVTEAEQYRRELERKTTKLEQFASVVSHDLRNPLSVAQGYAELAQEESENAEEYLAEVRRAHTQMDELISDLLTLAREGQSIEETHPTDVSDVVLRCWEGVDTANAELVVDAETTIMADPDRLAQLFENLFRNAVEHAGSDVTVTVGILSDGFYVSDDGNGIAESDHEDVFEYGYSTMEDGTGFGLSIVKEIVDGHGWEITLTESVEGGLRFEVTDVEFAEELD